MATPYLVAAASNTSANTVVTVGAGGGSATQPGDALFAVFNGSAAVTVSDSKGNTYVLLNSDAADNVYYFAATYKGSPGTPTAALTLADTITFTTTSTSGDIIISACAGLAPQPADANPVASHTAATTWSQTVTPANAGDLVIAFLGVGGAPGSITWSGGFTKIADFSLGSNPASMAYQVAPSTATLTATVTGSSVTWVMGTASFAQAAPARPSPTPAIPPGRQSPMAFQRPGAPPPPPAVAGAPVYTRVHSPVWSNSNTSGAALSVTVAPTNIGDVMVAALLNQGGTSVASLSGGGVTTWTRIGTPWTDPEATPSIMEWWMGVVTSTGSSSLAVAWNAAVGAHFNEITVQDFHSSVSGGTWTGEGVANLTNVSAGTVHYPAITPTQAAEIYCGYASTPSAISVSAPLPAGFVTGLTSGNDCFHYGVNYAGGGVQPSHNVSLSEASWSIGICVYMAVGGAPTPVTLADAAGAAEALGDTTPAVPLADAAGAADAISLPSTTPYLIGQLSTNATGTAFTIPVTTGTASSDGIVVGSGEPGAGVISGVTDSRGNTWGLGQQVVSNPAVSAWVVTTLVAPLQAGDSIFITFSVNDSVFKEFIAAGVPGMSAPDTAAENTGSATSAAPSLPTLTLAAAGEYVLAFLSSGNAGGAVAWTTGTGLLTLHGGAGSYLSCAWVLAPSTAAVTPAGTLTSVAWRGVVIPFGVAGGTATPALPDVGGAADAITVPAEGISLADAAGAVEAASATVTVPLAESAGGTEQVAIASAVPVAEVAAGAEALAVSATLALADQAAAVEFSPRELYEAAGAADQVAATAAVPLAETAAGVESVAVATTLAVTDNAAAVDQPSISTTALLTEAGAGADASAATVTLPLADVAGSADALLSGQPTALADAAGAADSLAVPAEAITLADAGAATEAIPIAETSGLPEAAGAAEALAVTVTVPLAEAGAGAEALTAAVVLPLADRAAAVEYTPVSGLADAAGAAEAVLPAVTTQASDTAGAADVLSWTGIVTVPDTGAGREALAAAATVGLAENGAASEAQAVAASTPVAEAAGAADVLVVTGAGTPTLAEAGGAAEALAVNVTLAVPDVAAGADSLATFQGAAISLADAGGAADTIGVAAAAAVSFGEAGAATESAAAVVAAPAADTAAAAEGVTVNAALPLADQTGAAADALGASVSAAAPEAAGGTERLAVAAQALAGDRAGAAEALGVSKPVVPLAEAAGAVDGISVTIALSFRQMPGWDVQPADPVWMAYPDAPEWAVEPVSGRWTAHSQAGQWAADAAPTRWRIVMGTFEPIAAVSTENINARWTSDQDGTVIDPVAGSYAVQFAFPASSGDENHPAAPVTWYPGVWVTPNGSAKGFLSQCLAGPQGGVVVLIAGHSYDVWAEVDTGTERVRKFVGVQAVY